MIRRSTQARFSIYLIAAALLGCQPKPPPTQQQSGEYGGAGLDTSVKTVAPETAVRNDPCAARLQTIGGALLLYWATNKHMPQNLDELKPFADFDEPIELTCPVSHKPYLYAPNGLAAAGKEKRIVVYDAESSHNGNRWCLFMIPPRPGQALATEVLEVPEGIFHTFTPAD
jgi:hypothetical protein